MGNKLEIRVTVEEVKSGLVLDTIFSKGAIILEYLRGEDEAIPAPVLMGTLLLLNLLLDEIDGIRTLDVQREFPTHECL